MKSTKKGVNMNRIKSLLIALAASLTLAACASMTGVALAPFTKANDGVLAGNNNMTLYIFTKDVAGSGKSVCNGMCATNWPPLLVDGNPAVSSGYSIVTRDDGKKQLAFNGMPLYFYAKDTKPGDKIGDGRSEGAWQIIKM
jgi:predicted lipoprotein with Yx(FWY)xxD motif